MVAKFVTANEGLADSVFVVYIALYRLANWYNTTSMEKKQSFAIIRSVLEKEFELGGKRGNAGSF